MSTITVAAIETKPKRSIVITADGRRLGCWTDKIAKLGLEQGASYNIETADTEFGDKVLTNIVSAKRVTMGLPRPGSEPLVSSTYHQSEGNPRPAAGAAFRTPEQMFVSEVLTAYITNGRCEPQKLTETINFIRTAWDRTFGGSALHQHLEAAE
jgi:hypothetical protein